MTFSPTISATLLVNISQPGVCEKTGGLPIVSSKLDICSAYSETLASLPLFLPLDDTDANILERSNIFGVAVRLAFHDAGEFDQNSYDEFGPDGCLSFSGENAGLIESDGIVSTFIEPLWQNVCDRITRADFWVMFAKIVLELADPTKTLSIPFHYGRIDALTCDNGAGRLPGAQQGFDELNRVFVNQMGLDVHSAVTLLGAHTLGHVHPQFSGYGRVIELENYTTNSWDPTPHLFDNQYYQMLKRVSYILYTDAKCCCNIPLSIYLFIYLS